jgi:hypothetical protein
MTFLRNGQPFIRSGSHHDDGKARKRIPPEDADVCALPFEGKASCHRVMGAGAGTVRAPTSGRSTCTRRAQTVPPRPLPLFSPPLTDETLSRVRRDFSGWDVYALKAEFDAWLAETAAKQPDDYQGLLRLRAPATRWGKAP